MSRVGCACTGFRADVIQCFTRIYRILAFWSFELSKFTFKYEPNLSNIYAYVLRLG